MLKIELPDQPFKYVTENSKLCDEETAFVLTKQNEKYLEDAKQKAHSIISIEEIGELFGINEIKITYLLDLGYKAALQGTRGFFMNDEVIEGKSLTTPSVLHTYIGAGVCTKNPY